MRRGDVTREKLLAETFGLVRRNGFKATSVNDVLQATGVKKGALYHHFPGKDDLGMAVLERTRQCFFNMIDSTLRASSPLAGLDLFLETVLQKQRENGFVGGCLWGNTVLEMSDIQPTYTKFVEHVFDEWVARMEVAIRAGQCADQIRTDLPAADLARLLVAGIEGGIMMSRLTKQEGPLKTCLTSLRQMLVQSTVTVENTPNTKEGVPE